MKKINYKYICRHPYDDRLFSQIIRHLLSYFISKINNIIHIHIPYKDNSINEKIKEIYNIDNLIDTKSDIYDMNKIYKEIYSAPDQNLVKNYDINDIFSDKNIEIIKNNYKLKKVSDYYSLSKINVCIHIRRGDIVIYGEKCGRYTTNEFFIDIIKKIYKILKNKCVFHIYSDSDIKLNLFYDNIKYHINTDLLISVNEMIQSDIFIMSIGSNLSHFIGLHTSGIVYFDKNKIIPCFNYNYNIYWSKYIKFISDENIFIQKILLLNKN